MTFGDTLLKVRTRLELTQDQLAKSLGLAHKVVLYRWEAGQREPLELVRRLILLLNDLPKKEALEFISKLESYGKRKTKQ